MGERRCGSDDVCEFDLLFQSFTVVEPRFAHGHPQTHTHSRYLVTFIRGLCALLLCSDARVLLGFNEQVAVRAVVTSAAGMDDAFSPTVRFSFSQGMSFRRVANPNVHRCSPLPSSNTVDCILLGVIRPNAIVSCNHGCEVGRRMYVSPSSLIHPPPLHSCSYLPVQVNVTVYFSVTVNMMAIDLGSRIVSISATILP